VIDQQRDRIAAAFERALADSPVPPELRSRAVRSAMLSRSEVAHSNHQWALALVAVLIAIAIVGTLIGVRALRSPTPAPIKHGPPIVMHQNGFIVIGGDNNLTAIDPATGAMHTIWSVSPPNKMSDVAYSPDGTRVAYLQGSTELDGGQLWVLDTTTHRAQQLTNCTCRRFSHVSWSPDGLRLAFSDGGQLYLIDNDGTHSSQLTHLTDGSDPIQPTWSPDGNLIAFKSQNDIDVIKPDGSGLAVLLTEPSSPWDPAWSPDGSRIAYVVDPVSPSTFDFQVWLMNPDGSHRTMIFVSHGCCVTAWGGPAWSPDGTQIAVAAYPSPGWYLWVMNADGSDQRNLGHVNAVDRPAWQPVP
jgi:Tol biopolymer transport system component